MRIVSMDVVLCMTIAGQWLLQTKYRIYTNF